MFGAKKTSLLQRFNSQLGDFTKVMGKVDLNSLSVRLVVDKWSAKEQLAHLGRYQEVFQGRLNEILRGDVPRFERYRAEDDPKWPEWAQRPAETVVPELWIQRWMLSDRLGSLKKDDWKKTGIHPVFGEMDLALWVEFFLLHEAHHLYQVFQQVRQSKAA